MSKFKKLINTPGLYFKDAFKNQTRKKNINSDKDINSDKKIESYKKIEDDLLLEEERKSDYLSKLKVQTNNSFGNYVKSQVLKDNILSNVILANFQYEFYLNEAFFEKSHKSLNNKENFTNKIFETSYTVDGIDIPRLFDHWNNYEKAHSFSDALALLVQGIKKCKDYSISSSDSINEQNKSILNASAINPYLNKVFISNFMLYELINQDRDLNLLRNPEELYWWWVTYVLPINGLDSTFIPTEMIAFYLTEDFFQEDLKIALPKFLHSAFKASNIYQERYKLTDEVGFIGFVLDFYIHNISNPINHIFLDNELSSIFEEKTISFTYKEAEYHCNILAIIQYMHDSNDFLLNLITPENLIQSDNVVSQQINLNDTNTYQLISSDLENKKCMLVGLYYSSTGLAANLKMMSKVMRHLGISHHIYDVETKSIIKIDAEGDVKLKNNLNIFMINADMIPNHFLLVNDLNKNALNIGFLLWELEYIPVNQKLALDVLDLIWVPTNYLLDIYKKETDTPVNYVGKYISLPEPTKKYKSKQKFSFYMSFDFHSNIERKNPIAAIKAFKLAFGDNENVRFVLKTTEILRNHPGNRKGQWENILKEINNDKRFKVISGRIPFQKLINQINSMDCIVSSHRSEGFGYLLAHAFLLSKPVIVTDYSGTSDFCTKETAYLVRWHKLNIEPGDFGSFVDTGFWANVDIQHMAEQMRKVYRDREEAFNKATKGKNLIESRYSLQQFSENIRDALQFNKII